MCVDKVLNVVFVILTVVGLLFTLVALFLPDWREHENEQVHKIVQVGICGEKFSLESCKSYYKSLPGYVKGAVACMCLAIVCCCLALMWSCIYCYMCCFKGCLSPPLPILAGFATLFLIIGITVLGVGSEQEIDLSTVSKDDWWDKFSKDSSFGKSMYLGIAAIFIMFIDTIVGIVMWKTTKILPV